MNEETKLTIFEEVMERQGDTEQMPAEAWADISEEMVRVYRFAADAATTIVRPVALAINQRGSHRIIDADGISHYIPPGWIHLSWRAKDSTPYFRF